MSAPTHNVPGDLLERVRAAEERYLLAEQALRRRDAILQSVAASAEQLLAVDDWDAAITDVLKLLGAATGVSRAYIYENHRDGPEAPLLMSQRWEWCAPGVTPELGNPSTQGAPYVKYGFADWENRLGSGQPVYGHVDEESDFSPRAREILARQGIKSIMVVPISVGMNWWGFIGFDECSVKRDWTVAEAEALKTAAAIVGAAIHRRNAERELQRQRDFNNAVVDAAPALLVVLDRNGRVVLFNRAAELVTGYSAEEITGGRYDELMLLPEERDQVRAQVDRVWQGSYPSESLYAIRTKAGRKRLIAWSNTLLFDQQGEPEFVAGIGLDVTERHRAENQLRESEQQYRGVFEVTSDGLMIADAATGEVLAANPAYCQMHGYAVEEVIGQPTTRFVHPDDRQVFRDSGPVLEAGGQFRAQVRNLRKDGTVFPVEALARGFTYQGRRAVLNALRDVTEQVRAMELLEERVEERTRELEKRTRETEALYKADETLYRSLRLEDVLNALVAVAQDILGADLTTVRIWDEEHRRLGVGASRGFRAETVAYMEQQKPGYGITYLVATSGEPVAIEDARFDTRVAREIVDAEGVRALLHVPIKVGGRVFGVFGVNYRQPHPFTGDELRILLSLAQRAGVAIQNARLYEQAQGKAALEERQKLARELHDSVSQALYGIALGARTAATLLQRGEAGKVAQPLEYVLHLADAGLAEMRALIFELRPESLAEEGLVAALQKQAASVRARHGLAIEPELGPEPETSLRVKEVAYRVAQEAMHNVVKHARATAVGLRLWQEDGRLVVEVADNGAGFDPEAAYPGHLGLVSMRERAALVDGSVEILSAMGEGTRLRLTVPLTEG